MLKTSIHIYISHIERILDHPLIHVNTIDPKNITLKNQCYAINLYDVHILTKTNQDIITTPTHTFELKNNVTIDNFEISVNRRNQTLPNIIDVMGVIGKTKDARSTLITKLNYYNHYKTFKTCTNVRCKWCLNYYIQSNREAFIKHSKTIHDQLSFVQENKLYSCYRFRLCKKYYELFPSAFVLQPYEDMVFYFLKLYFALKNYQLDQSLNVKMGSITKPLIKGIHFIIPKHLIPRRFAKVLSEYEPIEIYKRLNSSEPNSSNEST